MPTRTRLQWERERRAAESPDARRSGFSDADRDELLCLQAADKPHCGRKGSRPPVNLAHARPTMLCIH